MIPKNSNPSNQSNQSNNERLKIIESLSRNPSAVLLLVSVVFGFGMSKVYEDRRVNNEVLIVLIREQVRESRSVTDALTALSVQIERSTSDRKKTD